MAAANAFGIGLSVGRSYTVSPTTGITSAVLTGNNCKLRTSYATTGVGAIAIANGANITGQTRTLDSQPAGSVVNGLLAPLGSGIAEATLFDAYLVGHPIILANNEGLALTNLVTLPATGVINFGITVQWNEVTAGEWV
jgi:hypothetical protein